MFGYAFPMSKSSGTCGIYGIYNRRTGKCLYIGQSRNIELRWKNHIKLMKSGKHPQKGLTSLYFRYKNKSTIFDFVILEVCYPSRLSKRERAWFNKENPSFYSKLPDPSFTQGRHSEVTRSKISAGVSKSYETRVDGDRRDITVCNLCETEFLPRRSWNDICTFCSKSLYLSKISVLYASVSDEELFQMIHLDGLSYRKVALKVGCSHVAVAKRWNRIRPEFCGVM